MTHMLIPTEPSLTTRQVAMLEHYSVDMDPDGCVLLGFHRGRPVIRTHLERPGLMRGEKRHVVCIGKSGCPIDLNENWLDHFEFAPNVDPKVVCGIIDDWLGWSIRA